MLNRVETVVHTVVSRAAGPRRRAILSHAAPRRGFGPPRAYAWVMRIGNYTDEFPGER